MKIAIFGIGGIGGLVGGALAQVHPDTFFYARGETLLAIRKYGLQIYSPTLGSFVAHPRLATDQAQEIGPMDIIILACKGYNLPEVCQTIWPMIGRNTLILPLVNGVLVSELLSPFLPSCVLADGVIRVSSRKINPGEILQESSACSLLVGLRNGETAASLNELVRLLQSAGLTATISPHIELNSWEKFASMSSNSVAYLYYDGSAGTVRRHPGYQTVLEGIISPVIRIASAKGTNLPSTFSKQYLQNFQKLPEHTTTSLYRDLKCGTRTESTELYHIVGRIVAWGQEIGIPVPYHQAVYNRYNTWN